MQPVTALEKEIVELGKENPDLLVLDIDIGKSCKTGDFRKELPQQYLNVGIAEQNGAGLAAGLATCGKVPFVVTYAVFGSLRMCEMIRQEICYPNPNVKIACSHGGVAPANDGASHQAIEDHNILNGLGSAVCEVTAELGKGIVKRVGIQDQFIRNHHQLRMPGTDQHRYLEEHVPRTGQAGN